VPRRTRIVEPSAPNRVSDSVGLNSRLRWIIEPGRELGFVINHGWSREDSQFHSDRTEVVAKLSWLQRF